MEDEKKLDNKYLIKITYLLKQVFFGVTSWMYVSAIFGLSKINSYWLTFTLFCWLILGVFVLNNVRKHNNEFGKYTYVIGIGVFLLTVICLAFIGLYKVSIG